MVVGAPNDHLPSTGDHHDFAFGATAMAKNPDLRNISFEDAHAEVAVARQWTQWGCVSDSLNKFS